jgi:hypothetical protein
VGFVDGETGYRSETCVVCDVGKTAEFGIKLEEAVDVKREIPQAMTFPPIKTEHEVRLWGLCQLVTAVVCDMVTDVVCEVVTAPAFRPFIALTPKGNYEITCNWYLLCVMLCVITFETLIAILKSRDFLLSYCH